MELLVISSHISVKGRPDFASSFHLGFNFVQILLRFLFIILLFLLQSFHLCSDGIDLRVVDILSALHVDHLVVFLVFQDLEVPPHRDVLRLEKVDMLMRGLLIVEKPTNTRVAFIIDNFLLQDFELKLHKVDLLLEVGNILILNSGVGVLAQALVFAFILASELDSVGGLVRIVLENTRGCSSFRHFCNL